MLQQLNSEGKRKVPDEASLEFIPHSWKSYLYDGSGSVSRRTYEICTLWELRSALKAGNIWVEHSRRYNNPASYLIPKEKWLSSKDEMCRLINLPKEADVWLSQKEKELESTLSQVNKNLPKNSKVRIEKGELIISPIEAEELPSSCRELQKLINKLIPRVELVDLLIEVDSWTRFSDKFEHAAGSQPRNKELLRNIYASILAQSCNFGFSQMSELAGVSYEQLVWCNNWYIRDETLKAANDILVNYQYSLPLSKYWGGGTLSSSDGQRFPVPVKAQNATALPKYFGYGKGLTFYSWTSDQFSQYGSKVIPTTVRDATYVLDAILDNETELEIMEHTTDTAGYTELVFALFGLLGMKFSPRIKDILDQKIYRMDKTKIYKNLESLIKGTINKERISRNWDDILRIAASIKLGWVTASLIISKLKEYPQKNALASALIECGRIEKSIFIPSYIDLETERRRLGIQLNKGESIHSLRQFLFFANEGKIWRSQLEDQTNQASCLTLLTNAIICWNTRYMQAILDQLKSEGYQIQESDLPHTAPCRVEHINRYGKYNFNIEEELNRKGLRSLNR